MKKIVLALDFSELSLEVERVGMELAGQLHDATVVFLTVINQNIEFIPPDTGVLVGPWEARLEQAKLKLREIRDKYPAANIEIRTFIGDPKYDILNAVKETGGDLLVIGTHGRTGWRYTVMGSNAEYMVRHSVVPVLVVPLQR